MPLFAGASHRDDLKKGQLRRFGWPPITPKRDGDPGSTLQLCETDKIEMTGSGYGPSDNQQLVSVDPPH
jgi:hypothetical protein